jgi:D-methionine transport system ATP-binding protein
MSKNQFFPSGILQWHQVTFSTPITEQILIQDISTAFSYGERIGLIGASGAGKSTLLKLSNNLLSPSQGNIYFQQKSLADYHPLQLRREIVLVLQEPKLLGLTVQQSLIYPLQWQGLHSSQIQSRLTNTLATFSLPDSWLEKKEGELSLGQRQLVAIARAFMMQPKVLLLDEPISALDQGKSQELLQILITLSNNSEILIMVANHQLDWLKEFATRVIVLEKGKLTQDLATTEVNWQEIKQSFLNQINKSDFADF